jgi:hypothetical protein
LNDAAQRFPKHVGSINSFSVHDGMLIDGRPPFGPAKILEPVASQRTFRPLCAGEGGGKVGAESLDLL